MAAVEGSYRGYWLGAALAILVMVALPVLVIMRVTVPSVRQMVLAAERIRQGDLEQRFQASGTRELVQIGEALDAMVAQIQSSVEERSKALAALEESEKVARSMLAQKELDEAELKKRYEVIETQQLAIRAMSTPIIRVWNEVLALPVVGLLDRERATEIMEKLLAAIAQQRARVAIVDLTGVESVDEATAEHLVKLMQSVRLLGARGIVTGLRPEVARRLVATGVELQGVETLATLHEAIRMCLQGPAGQAPGRPGRRSS
jgi:anti-anti-sigma factor